MRLPERRDLQKFCAADCWRELTTSRGKTGDHARYEKALADGSTLRTKVSHGGGTIGAGLFKHILREQLHVTEDQFWMAVDRGLAPRRAGDEPSGACGERLPHDLVSNLVRRAGYAPHDVLGMSKEQAVAAWQRWLTECGVP